MSKSKYGKKVVKSVVNHRTCGVCKWWQRNRPGLPVRKHRCVRNHVGSAKLMESTGGLIGVKDLAAQGTPVECIEGDGDNTLIARIKKDLNISLKKKFDKNHVLKNIGKSLYALHAEKGIKLSKTVILHIQKCLKYIFAKNAGDKDKLQENLKALIPHQFGDHSLCEGRFCGFKRTPSETYVHRSLPYKAALKDDILRSRLESLFQPIIANAEQYADLGSSQQCEHANREVTLRAPKSLHYGNSESLDFRVHATAAFINEGRHYISQVNTTAGLSPGTHTEQYATKMTKKRKAMQEKSQLPSTKRRRMILKQERAIVQSSSEVLEGISYQSGIGHDADTDIESLPEAIPRGIFKPICLRGDVASFVTFDLETTDLIHGRVFPHITQMTAYELHSGATFSVYVIPRLPISSSAQQVTGIAMNGSNCMTVCGRPVDALGVHEAFDSFIKWINTFPNAVLIAHNGRRFDFPVLMNTIMNIGKLNEFFGSVCGFIDSLSVFRKVYPERKSYKQEDLVKSLLNTSYDAHNAIRDVNALGKLIRHLALSTQELLQYSFPPRAVHSAFLFREEKAKNLPSLNPLISHGVMKMCTAENVAGSGLQLAHLRKIFERDGEDGLRNTFIAPNSEGQPRVTNVKRTLESVLPKLVDYFFIKN